jgi:phenylacetate-CoA ligase
MAGRMIAVPLFARHVKPVEKSFYQPEIQTMPVEQIRELQLERLRNQVKAALEKPIPFWKRKLTEAGITSADDIKSLDDLTRIPVTFKDELRESERMHPPFGDYRGVGREGTKRIGTTSGTTGVPTTTLWTKNDLEAECIAGARTHWRAGIRPGMWIVHAHPLGIYGSSLFTSTFEYMDVCPITTGVCATEAELETVLRYLEKIGPDYFSLFPTSHARFYEKAIELGLDLDQLNLPEPSSIWPQAQSDTVSSGVDAFAFLGGVCGERNGSHIPEDLVIIEALDPITGKPVADGERGQLAVTTITKDNFVLRYNVEDIVRIYRGECTCGETHARMFFDGREKDIVQVNGNRILPLDVESALSKNTIVQSSVIKYQMIRRKKGAEHDSLRIRFENEYGGTSEAATLEIKLSNYLSETLHVPVNLQLVPKNCLPRDTFKPNWVVDEE